MIHKLSISLLGILFCTALSAQVCTIDTTLKSPGYKPDSLPYAAVNVAYAQSITVRSIKDTTTVFGGNTVAVTIDSVKVRNVIGMPAGFTYQCLNPRCIFLPQVNSCVLLSGTATQPGIYPIKIAVLAYARIAGSFKVQQPDTITRFRIVVTGTGGFSMLEATTWKVYPNPATTELTVMNAEPGVKIFRLLDLWGREISVAVSNNAPTLKLNISALASGIYLISDGESVQRFVKN